MSEPRNGFILQPGSRIRDGRAVVQLTGRLEDGPGFLIEDDRFKPYFFVLEDDAIRLRRRAGVALTPSTLVDFAGRRLVRAEVDLPGRVAELRQQLEAAECETFEADIRFPYRYLIDHGLRTAISIEGEAEPLDSGVLRFRNPTLAPASYRPELRTLSIDIETTPDASRVLSFAWVGCGADEVHLVGERPVPAAAVHPDERALLEAFTEGVRRLDPDLLTGWNVVDFDLQVLLKRATACGLGLRMGRLDLPVRIQRDMGFTRQSRAEVPGRQVLDAQGLVRDASISLPDYRLETAAQVLLGRGKRIADESSDRGREIERLYREDPAAFVAYNREDARLVLDILEQEGLVELTVERSLLSGMQLDRVGASIASFDRLYLPELRRRGFVAPSVQVDRKTARVQGGAVLDSSPGLFRNVAVFDFKSLYPSLIRTFNLEPLAHARAGSDAIVAPNGAAFARGEAILPAVLEAFASRRSAAKQRGDRHADLALKIMMNALFGVLGAGSCRFFSPAVANAITGFGQQTLLWAREEFEGLGVRVLYGDTDSIFVELGESLADSEARARAESLRDRVQRRIEARVEERYAVVPQLELELEYIYARFFQPSVRGGAAGSKKRYAGWLDGRVVVVGLEAVRRDWPPVARRLQLGMLERLFRDEPVLPFVRDTIARVQEGGHDSELVIRKGIRKGSLDRYTASAPPHVQAARKAGLRSGREVRYVMTETGAEPVLEGRPLPDRIDRKHYLERVLRPVADAILPFVDASFDEALGRPRQLSLL